MITMYLNPHINSAVLVTLRFYSTGFFLSVIANSLSPLIEGLFCFCSVRSFADPRKLSGQPQLRVHDTEIHGSLYKQELYIVGKDYSIMKMIRTKGTKPSTFIIQH